MVTILLPISRDLYLRPVFDCLNALERPSDTELIIITDGDTELQKAVDKRLDSINYARVQILNFGDTPAETINDRRYRISAIHNKLRHYLSDDTDYVFTVECDTTYPSDTLTKMLDTMERYEACAFVEAVQLGRHRTPYIGAWLVDDPFFPQRIESVLPNDEDIQKISAGGLYCALIDADLYAMHQFQPYDQLGTNGLSCDVDFGLYLTQQGYECYIDWTIQTDHIGERGAVNLGNTKPVKVVFNKNNKGGWLGETI